MMYYKMLRPFIVKVSVLGYFPLCGGIFRREDKHISRV